MELLHESRDNIVKIEGKLYFFQCRPEIHETPVLEPDTFVDGGGVSIYGSVLHDSGRYRMWYQAWPSDWEGGDVSLVGYAESDNGIDWKKPELGLVDYNGKRNNLCNLGFHSPTIFIDPDATPDFRYRATGYSMPGRVGSAPVSRRGYYTAHSSEGIRWELDDAEPRWEGGDVISSVYHPARHAGTTALKRYCRLNGAPRRSIFHSEYSGGGWSDPRLALIPDEYDDVCAAQRGFVSGDYYGMGFLPAGGGMVGFLWQFRHKLPRTRGTESGVFGATDVSLVFQQSPGYRWLHVPGRPDFIRHDDIGWGPGGVYTAACPVDFTDTQRLYFTGTLHTHAWYLNESWKLREDLRDTLIEDGMCRIGFASWKKNRLFGFRADPEGMLELDIGAVQHPAELHINYRCEKNGSVRVEGDTTSDVLTGDEIDATVRWNGKSIITANNGDPLKLHLQSAQVFAYQIVPIEETEFRNR